VNPSWRIIEADALTALDEFSDESFDFVFADPPYFLSNDGFTVKSGKAVSVNKGEWDRSRGFDEDLAFHERWIRESVRVLKPDGTIAISGTYHSTYQCGFVLQKLGCRVINEIIWFKPNGAPALAGRNFTASHETIIWASKGKSVKHTFNYRESREWNDPSDQLLRAGKQMRSVWSIPNTPKREKVYGAHPTQKPLQLMERLIVLCSKPGDTVLDPFSGSGSTGVVCVKNGRNFIGIELEAQYVKLSTQRIARALETTQKLL
jgi:site-specific DNA-methyltransferase (adenine-specific)